MLKQQISVKMLASVASVEEALIALEAGVDMIDLKNPALGALGALNHALVKEIVLTINQRSAVSATIGDLPMDPDIIFEASSAMIATGVDIVKIGFFGRDHHTECLKALKPLSTDNKLIAVLFSDEQPKLNLMLDSLALFANAGFYGVMLDTADKTNGHLLSYLDVDQLAEFVRQSKMLGLITGLAGSIQAEHINQLLIADPSYLGFRGALCEQNQRVFGLDISKVKRIKNQLH